MSPEMNAVHVLITALRHIEGCDRSAIMPPGTSGDPAFWMAYHAYRALRQFDVACEEVKAR